MTTTTFCDACGEPIDGRKGDRIVHVDVHDLSQLMTVAESVENHSYDFHRACFLASIRPTFDELRG